jgi:hypothetical protein
VQQQLRFILLITHPPPTHHETLHTHLQALEGKLAAVQRELQTEAARRLAAAETEWSSRLAAREQELQHNAQMQLQQVGRGATSGGQQLGWCTLCGMLRQT